MSRLTDAAREKARKLNRHIVLPEGEEPRVVEGAKIVVDEGIARITLLGDETAVRALLGSCSGIDVVDPKASPKADGYVDLLVRLRSKKGMTPEKARGLVLNDTMHYGALMLESGDADGMVGGARRATSDVLRPALQIIKTRPGASVVSSCMIMCLPEPAPYAAIGDGGVIVVGDCAVNIAPDPEQLADIAIACEETARTLAGIEEPRVALLSFSTKGSAKHENADKVIEALRIIRAKSDIKCDGELQFDSAVIPSVAAIKAPGSEIAGRANVLIFPDLQAGNIGYKIIERLGGAECVGPICQGFRKPVNDVSRGCGPEDIANIVAMTAIQAGEARE